LTPRNWGGGGPSGLKVKLFLPILDTNILTLERAFYNDPLLSYRVNRKTERQTDTKFFLLNRVLGVLKRGENTKKWGRNFFFRHDSNMGRIPIRAS
jgi:hypothetical protein